MINYLFKNKCKSRTTCNYRARSSTAEDSPSGSAPTILFISLPSASRKTNVGIAETEYFMAVSVSWSTSMLTKLTLSLYSPFNFSKKGEIALHGPHHVA